MSLETKDRKGFFIFEVINFHNDKKISKYKFFLIQWHWIQLLKYLDKYLLIKIIHIYIYIYTYIYTYIYIYIHMYVCIYMYIYILKNVTEVVKLKQETI